MGNSSEYDPDTHVTVTHETYWKLLRASNKLKALEAAGVDNWEWYGEAMESMDD